MMKAAQAAIGYALIPLGSLLLNFTLFQRAALGWDKRDQEGGEAQDRVHMFIETNATPLTIQTQIESHPKPVHNTYAMLPKLTKR